MYFPDLNRIEACWGWIKNRVRKLLRDSYDLKEAIDIVNIMATKDID